MKDLSDDTVQELIVRAKQSLRRRMRGLRSALPQPAFELRCQRICDSVLSLPEVGTAQRVGLFWPIAEKREIDTIPLDLQLRNRGKTLYYPFMDPMAEGGFLTGFRTVPNPTDLADRGRGFCEPDPNHPAATRGELDVIIVPALAVDPRGHRLGYGGGVYDATLPDLCPPATAIVVAFDFQLVVDLPITDLDVACSIVVTDSRTMRAMVP